MFSWFYGQELALSLFIILIAKSDECKEIINNNKISPKWRFWFIDCQPVTKSKLTNCNPLPSLQSCTFSPNYCFCFTLCNLLSNLISANRFYLFIYFYCFNHYYYACMYVCVYACTVCMHACMHVCMYLANSIFGGIWQCNMKNTISFFQPWQYSFKIRHNSSQNSTVDAIVSDPIFLFSDLCYL